MAFLQYYEKRLKLQLLRAELEDIKKHAKEDLIKEGYDAKVNFGMGEIGLTVIETVLADTYTILAGQQELLQAIAEIRNRSRKVNDLLRVFYRNATVGWYGANVPQSPEIERHNGNIERQCKPIVVACTRALTLLDEVMAAL